MCINIISVHIHIFFSYTDLIEKKLKFTAFGLAWFQLHFFQPKHPGIKSSRCHHAAVAKGSNSWPWQQRIL